MSFTRREFLSTSAAAAAALCVAPALAEVKPPVPLGRAEHCIFLWLGGGMAQIDTFDPKKKGDPKQKKAGAAYDSIPTSVAGIEVSEHLKKTAEQMERISLVRTVRHPFVAEHATATHFVHTGRLLSETIRYPSIGSIVAHEKEAVDGMPPYLVIGYPNASRDPGFLGPKCGYLHVTDVEAGPNGFVRPSDVSDAREARRRKLLEAVRRRSEDDGAIAAQEEAIAQFERLGGEKFLKRFALSEEPAKLREDYGLGFGQRCLLARRLVESGVRFVEVSFNLNFLNGTGWDTHNEGQQNQHILIQELDSALSALIRDLESRRLLDKILIALGTEFGRPPEFDGGGGRGHQSECFTMLLAGGGLRHGQAIGASDELAKKAISPSYSIPDFHATLLAGLGIDPAMELYDGNRPVPVTDGGKAIREMFE